MAIDINALRKNFASMSDASLRKLTQEALGLTSDGLQALKEEITKRNLPLLRSLDNVFKDKGEIDNMIKEKCAQLRDQLCPVCNGDEYLINAIWLTTVSLGGSSRAFHFACGRCLVEEKRKAENKITLFGWWGLYKLIASHHTLKANDKEMKDVETCMPTNSLLEYAANLVEMEFKLAMMEVDIQVKDKVKK